MGSNCTSEFGSTAAEAIQPEQVAEVQDSRRRFVVMVCDDTGQSEQAGLQLSEIVKSNSGCLAAYRRMEDLAFSAPAGEVAMVIFSTHDEPLVVRRALRWLHHRWPRCCLVVVGGEGSSRHEIAAREGGACYLTGPVEPDQWRALLGNVWTRTDRIRTSEGLMSEPGSPSDACKQR